MHLAMKDFDSSLTVHLFDSDSEDSVEELEELTISEPRQRQCLGVVFNRMIASSFGQLACCSRCSRKKRAWHGQPSLTEIVERVPPVLFTIIDFLADRPLNVVRLSCWTASFIHAETSIASNPLWNTLYERRWPAFHDALCHTNRAKSWDWRSQYQETLFGKTKVTLEVYHRELKRGFVMSVMPANVRFEASLNAYVAEYISASEVRPEAIPGTDSHRLRFCPPGTRDRLEVGLVAQSQVPDEDDTALCYPYRVLQDHDGLVPGQSVELQWKMQQASPFGWWYGTLESIAYEDNGPHATATITFGHFPSDSRWYRMQVRCGDSEVRTNDYGGFTGGIRACSAAEARHWNRHFPPTILSS
jgi:hypothetical protein